jgi:hypothetical protein
MQTSSSGGAYPLQGLCVTLQTLQDKITNWGAVMMREITVQELEAAQALRERPFAVCLNIWARWMRLKDHQVSLGTANEQDTKDFMRSAEAIDVMIDALPRVQWWAVRRAKGICTVWIFRDQAFEAAFAAAEERLTPLLQQHVATRRHFD